MLWNPIQLEIINPTSQSRHHKPNMGIYHKAVSKVSYDHHQDQISGFWSRSSDLHAWALTWSGEQAWQVHGTGGGKQTWFLNGKQTHGKMRILFQSISRYLVFLFFWGALWWAAENRVVLSESIQIWTEYTFKHLVFTKLCTQKCQKSIRLGFYSEVLGYNHLVPCNSHAKSCLQFVFKSHLVMDTSG